MNREILFKAKRKDNNEWVYGLYTIIMVRNKTNYKKLNGICFVSADAIYDITAGFSGEKYEVIPETVSQYTGLKDKNGVKIFEGDIIKAYCTFKNKWITGIVKFDMFNGLELEIIDDDEIWHFDHLVDIEVIGNIFKIKNF